MEKSNTVSKQQIEQAVNQAVGYIRHWTKQELANILDTKNKQNLPLIVPFKNGYIVGNYALKNVNNHWHLIYRYNDNELVFAAKDSAVMYAVCSQSNKTNLAEMILKADQDLARVEVKLEYYSAKLRHLRKKKNYYAVDLYASRYTECKTQQQSKKTLLEKNLKLAKYFNF